MLSRASRLGVSFAVTLTSLVLGACDDVCGPQPLGELCGSRCPKSRAEAVVEVCSTDAGVGVTYHFDVDGKLVGAAAWTDTTNGQCNSFETDYGKRCEPGAWTERACSSG